MKKIIKKSIDEIKLSDLQKEEILHKITNKHNFNVNYLFRFACVTYLFVICFLIVGSDTSSSNVMKISSVEEINNTINAYNHVYLDYSLGEYLFNIDINNKTYGDF